MSTTIVLHEEEEQPMARVGARSSGAFVVPNTIPVIRGPDLRSGVPLVSGFMPAGVLIPDNYVIPYHDPRTLKGYQRLPQGARINELANDLRKQRTDLPTAILLNLRNREARQLMHDGSLDLGRLRGETALPPLSKFHVVDGQHRILALQKLIEDEEEKKDEWKRFVVPFVCMLGATEEEEMDQFYTVNSKAKSVRTDLALELLRQRAESDPKVLDALTEKGKDWQVRAQELVREVSEESPIWRGRIRFAAMDKGDTTMPSASMVTSLKPLLASPYFRALDPKNQTRILDSFWRGLRNLMIEAFDKPEEFVLQKGIGVIVLHTILVHIIEIIRAKGWSVAEPEAYERVLKGPLEKLQGDDGRGRPVSGIDFWRSAPEGAAGSYSSSAGRRVLIAKIETLLPRVEVV